MSKDNLVPVDGLSNVFFNATRNGTWADGTPREVIINPFLEPLITKLAMANPSWVFEQEYVQHYCGSNEKKPSEVNGFEVFDNNTPRTRLGTLGTSTRYSKGSRERVFEVWSKRLSQERERGREYKTKDEHLAAKAAKKYFNPPSLQVRLHQQLERGRALLMEEYGNARREVQRLQNHSYPLFEKFVNAKWDEFLDTLSDEERKTAMILPEISDTYRKVKAVSSAAQDGQVLTILIEGDKYVTHHKGTIEVKLSEELPDHIRGTIGMLKLLDVGAVIPGKGARVDVNSFVVVP